MYLVVGISVQRIKFIVSYFQRIIADGILLTALFYKVGKTTANLFITFIPIDPENVTFS